MLIFYGGGEFQNVQEITLLNMHLEKDCVVSQSTEDVAWIIIKNNKHRSAVAYMYNMKCHSMQ